MTKYYKHESNGSVAELVGKNENGVILLLDNGEERVLALSTFSRWWKAVNKVTRVEAPSNKQTRKPKDTNNKVPITDELVDNLQGVSKQLITTIMKLSETYNSNSFKRTTTGSYNLTKDGIIYLLVRLNKKGGTIYTKSKALGDKVDYIKTSGNFDAKIYITDWDSNIYKQVRKIHDLAINYQITKNIKN